MSAKSRRVGYNIKKAVEKAYTSIDDFAKDIGLSTCDVERLLAGRLLLPYKKLKLVSSLTNTPIKDLLDTSGDYKFIDVDFSNKSTQDTVLDIIDDYLNLVEAVSL